MARLLAALLLTTAASLLVVGVLSDAALSEAEVFWRTVLPDSPVPDAILTLLHPDTAKDLDAEGLSQNLVQPGDDNTGRLSRHFIGYHEHSSPSTRRVSQYFNWGPPHFIGYHEHSSPSTRRASRHFIGYHEHSSPSTTRPSRHFIGYHERSSPSPRRLSRHFIGYHEHSSPMPSGDDDTVAATLKSMFFHEETLQVGTNITFRFPPAITAPLGVLPRHVADSIPFSTSSLPVALTQLGIAADSVQAAEMQDTLHMCELPPLSGEPQFCATSVEALVEGAVATLGTNDIRAVTSDLPRSGAPLQPYTIRDVRPVEGSSFLSCHDQDYPYTVYLCHGTGSTRVYMVDMEGALGDMVTVVTVCHTDTSKWDPQHISFQLLGTKPGGPPVCHIMPYENIMWVKNAIRRSSA